MSTQPFRVLDLPAELRLRIYEVISPTTSKCVLISGHPDGRLSRTELVPKSLPVALLATCHQIKNEAASIFNTKLSDLRNEPMHFTVDCESAQALASETSPLTACFGLTTRPQFPPDEFLLQNMTSNNGFPLKPLSYEILPLQPPIIEEDAQALIEICAEMLPGVRSAPLTSARPFDVEISLTGEIKDWQPRLLNRFLYDATVMSNDDGLAVAVMAKKPEHRPADVPAQPAVCPDDTWGNWQQTCRLFQRPLPVITRPCLGVVDLLVDGEEE